MKRRDLLTRAGLAAGLLILNGRMTMAQDNSGTGALTRSTAALSDRALALPEFPALAFRTALPEGLETIPAAETCS